MKLNIHPLFFLVVIYFIIIGQLELLIGYLLAIFSHEIAHSQIAKSRGYTMDSITLKAFGGVLEGNGSYNKTDNILIALAGPLINAIFALICVAMWWLVPESYNFTMFLCIANLSLCLLNLLPLYPLDGSRIILALSKNKLKAIKILKFLTIFCGAFCFLAGIVVGIMRLTNFSIAIFGIFLFYNAFDQSQEESYKHISKNCFLNKNFDDGLKEISILITKNMQLFRIICYLKPEEFCVFYIMENGKNIFKFDETKLGEYCVQYDLTEKIGTILNL